MPCARDLHELSDDYRSHEDSLIGTYSEDERFFECELHSSYGMIAVRCMDNQFSEHRIKLSSDRLTFFNSTFDPNAGPRWPFEATDLSGSWNKSLSGIFCIDANFNRMPASTRRFPQCRLFRGERLGDLSPN